MIDEDNEWMKNERAKYNRSRSDRQIQLIGYQPSIQHQIQTTVSQQLQHQQPPAQNFQNN